MTERTNTPKEDAALDGLLDAALEISARWDNTVNLMREAFERGDEREALKLAKELCGFHDEAMKTPIRQPAKAKSKK